MSMIVIACVIWLCACVCKSVRLAFMHVGIVQAMSKSIRRITILISFTNGALDDMSKVSEIFLGREYCGTSKNFIIS